MMSSPADPQQKRRIAGTVAVLAIIAVGIYVAFILSGVLAK